MKFQPYTVASVQTSPVYLNPEATVAKACELIDEAARNGAELVVFPEVFVPGYPYWNWLLNPVEGSPWFERLYHASVDVPGPLVERLQATARIAGTVVIIGINERDARRVGTMFNTLLLIDHDGRLLGRHRKLVPTWAEKLTWTPGDGSSLEVHSTAAGPVGMLACGENTNPLARFALLSQGELVHTAAYIALPVAPPDYDMAEAIRIRSAAHSFEGKVFNVVACSTISEEMLAEFETTAPDASSLLRRKHSAWSGIVGPNGQAVSELIDDEGIVYATIDLKQCIRQKQMHDITGSYNRFDIFDLRVNHRQLQPVTFVNIPVDSPSEESLTSAPANGFPESQQNPLNADDITGQTGGKPT